MDQHPDIEWRAGEVPVSTRFGDPYYSLDNGLAETRHVFLDGNDLPRRFRPGFHVAELGFGTGLNLLALWKLWRDTGQAGTLHFTSFEAFPLPPKDITRAQAQFPEVADEAALLGPHLNNGETMFTVDTLTVTLILGDAREALPAWTGHADAWFLDGFSPARNPELWSEGLMAEVARHTAPAGTAATYTAAGFVRRGLEDAGFSVTRAPGYGRKRHMTQAVLA